MPQLDGFLRDRSPLDPDQKRRIRELTADWQLLADLSFADLILWVPLRKDFKSWPTGYVSVAHIRPTTAATVFPQDVIGDEIAWGARPRIDQALSGAEIVRDAQPEKFGDLLIKEETIPVIFGDQVIAVIARHRNAELMRQPSRLELNYREVAHNVYRMVAEGTFPYTEHSELFNSAVRVGDGLIRLDIGGVITYASPNAKSAFNRMGWAGELEGNVLGEVARKVSQVKREAHDEAVEVSLTGKSLRRVEIENSGGTIDLLALPLLAGGKLIGTFALAEDAGNPSAGQVRAEVSRGRITGAKLPVPNGNIADFAVVAARDVAGTLGLYHVELKGPGVERRSLRTIDPSCDHAKLVFNNAPAVLLGASACGWANVTSANDSWTWLAIVAGRYSAPPL